MRCLIQTLGAGAMLLQTMALRRQLAVEREAWPDLVIAALLNMTMLPISFTVGVYLLGPGPDLGAGLHDADLGVFVRPDHARASG